MSGPTRGSRRFADLVPPADGSREMRRFLDANRKCRSGSGMQYVEEVDGGRNPEPPADPARENRDCDALAPRALAVYHGDRLVVERGGAGGFHCSCPYQELHPHE
jgi:hypothetical protein